MEVMQLGNWKSFPHGLSCASIFSGGADFACVPGLLCWALRVNGASKAAQTANNEGDIGEIHLGRATSIARLRLSIPSLLFVPLPREPPSQPMPLWVRLLGTNTWLATRRMSALVTLSTRSSWRKS